jgi:hypothetical protein
MRKIKPNSNIWQYLNDAGVLEHGTEAEIKAAKKAYKKKYLLSYRQRQRREKQEYIILLSKENGEFNTVASAAKKHSMSVTAFLKTGCLAYINQHFIVPDRVQLAKMEQLLSQCLNEVQLITRTKEKYSWEREQKYEAIEKRIMKLETQIKEVLSNPPLVSDYGFKNQIT